jgi:hypothetical protein
MKNLLSNLFFLLLFFCNMVLFAQTKKPSYSLADTLRGSLMPERTWWDVQRYELAFKPDYNNKSISGSNEILYRVVKQNSGKIRMQIDLQEPLIIDSIRYNEMSDLKFEHIGSVWYAHVPSGIEPGKDFLSWKRTSGKTCPMGWWFYLHKGFSVATMDDRCLPGARGLYMVSQ